MEEDFATMSMKGICQTISRWLPDVQRLHGYTTQGVCEVVPMQECTDGSKKPFDLIWGTQTSLWTPHTRNVDRDCVPENTRPNGKVKYQETYWLLSCALQCHLLNL